jgi:hypothetical protein
MRESANGLTSSEGLYLDAFSFNGPMLKDFSSRFYGRPLWGAAF